MQIAVLHCTLQEEGGFQKSSSSSSAHVCTRERERETLSKSDQVFFSPRLRVVRKKSLQWTYFKFDTLAEQKKVSPTIRMAFGCKGRIWPQAPHILLLSGSLFRGGPLGEREKSYWEAGGGWQDTKVPSVPPISPPPPLRALHESRPSSYADVTLEKIPCGSPEDHPGVRA